MEYYAGEMQFEKAEMLRKKIDHLQNYKAKSRVVNEHIGNVDVFSILKDGDIAYVNYLMVSEGTIVLTKTIVLEQKLDESAEEVLLFAIAQLRATFTSEAKEIIVPFILSVVCIISRMVRQKLTYRENKYINLFLIGIKIIAALPSLACRLN